MKPRERHPAEKGKRKYGNLHAVKPHRDKFRLAGLRKVGINTAPYRCCINRENGCEAEAWNIRHECLQCSRHPLPFQSFTPENESLRSVRSVRSVRDPARSFAYSSQTIVPKMHATSNLFLSPVFYHYPYDLHVCKNNQNLVTRFFREHATMRSSGWRRRAPPVEEEQLQK